MEFRKRFDIGLLFCLAPAFASSAAAIDGTPAVGVQFHFTQLAIEFAAIAPWSKLLCGAAPVLGLLALWSESRAWLYALCGNYGAAARIYENQLRRGAISIPSYLRLAHLYLLLGRHDDRALLAYRAVLHLNYAIKVHNHLAEVVECELAA